MNHVTPRSMSPPATIWQDNGARFAKDEKENSSVWDKTKTTEISLTENVPQDLRHPSFVKELTTSISFFVKDEFGKRKIDEEEEETAQKVRRQHSENETPRKITITADNEQEATKLDSSSATSDTSCTETEILRLTPKEEPSSFGSPFSYEAIHDGYENIQIIELVKQETRISFEEDLTDSEKKRTSQTETEESITLQSEVVDQEGGISDLEKESVVVESVTKEPEEIKTVEEESDSVNKPAPEIVRRVKPVVLQKPKDLKRFATPGFNKTNLSKGELKSFPDEKEEIKSEKVSPKTLPNLVERRKSELMMLTEPLEKDWKAMSKPLKKQSSFKESWTERQTSEEEQKVFKDEIASLDKTDLSRSEASEEVVFRKKVVSGHTDEQPELMKVFARRSLKVRESEKIADDLQRSRDSDKENETNESPKEERKKSYEGEEKKECETEKEGNRNLPKAKTVNEVKVNITPLKPEVTSRKNVFQRYGRSLSENNAKKEEMDFKPFVLEENCLNKMRRTSDLTASNTAKEQKDEIDEEVEEEEEEETGFKRIQQRKAEWERRAQQSAK